MYLPSPEVFKCLGCGAAPFTEPWSNTSASGNVKTQQLWWALCCNYPLRALKKWLSEVLVFIASWKDKCNLLNVSLFLFSWWILFFFICLFHHYLFIFSKRKMMVLNKLVVKELAFQEETPLLWAHNLAAGHGSFVDSVAHYTVWDNWKEKYPTGT